MLYQPPPPPVRAIDYVILAAVGVSAVAAIWAGITVYFRVIVWVGDLAVWLGSL